MKKRETVEEFIARGGKIQQIPRGLGSYNALKPTRQMILINEEKRHKRLNKEKNQ